MYPQRLYELYAIFLTNTSVKIHKLFIKILLKILFAFCRKREYYYKNTYLSRK